MFPHERALVKRLEGKPFALIGVNSDSHREETKTKNEKEQITWRSFWNGGSADGPISTTWNVHYWPTVYIIDAKGVIRYKYLASPGAKVLDEAIDALMKENEEQAKKSSP
jgi:hypothetical protein